ncbi:unnamed protein product, partial [Onchocerca flexuosa]|uniref:Uncharacterized protein n=1 Tax=Onchocerca flexuosa TaxID=387005 RepID=A0A183HUL5_9BILA
MMHVGHVMVLDLCSVIHVPQTSVIDRSDIVDHVVKRGKIQCYIIVV